MFQVDKSQNSKSSTRAPPVSIEEAKKNGKFRRAERNFPENDEKTAEAVCILD